MRYILSILFVLFMANPAFSESVYCEMEGPHNCMDKNDEQLMAVTKNTINRMELTRDPHPFKTENDEVLRKAARQHAQLVQPAPSTDKMIWRD